MVERKGVSLEDFANSHRMDESFINGLLEKLALSISKIGTFEDEVKRIKDEIKIIIEGKLKVNKNKVGSTGLK